MLDKILVITIALVVAFALMTFAEYSTSHYNRRVLRDIKKELTYTHNIPRVIFRTYYTRNVKDLFYEYCYKPWKLLNPNYTMLWYMDKDCRNIMRSLGDRYYNAYKKVIPGAYKADLWRACMLYEHGGIYTDSYTIPFCSLSLMLSKCWKRPQKEYFISVRDRSIDPDNNTHGIHNGFMIATPKHPFMKQHVEDIVTNIESEHYGSGPLCPTGPHCLKKSINTVLGLDQTVDFKDGFNDYGNLSFYLFKMGLDAYQHIYNEEDNCIMQKKHSMITYLYDKIIKKSYLSSWHDRKIYKT